jgi:hypothetical protein
MKLKPVTEIMATIKEYENSYIQGLITRGEFLQAVAQETLKKIAPADLEQLIKEIQKD